MVAARPQSGDFEGGARKAGRRNARKRERLPDVPLSVTGWSRTHGLPPAVSSEPRLETRRKPLRRGRKRTSTGQALSLSHAGGNSPIQSKAISEPAGLSGGGQHRSQGNNPPKERQSVNALLAIRAGEQVVPTIQTVKDGSTTQRPAEPEAGLLEPTFVQPPPDVRSLKRGVLLRKIPGGFARSIFCHRIRSCVEQHLQNLGSLTAPRRCVQGRPSTRIPCIYLRARAEQCLQNRRSLAACRCYVQGRPSILRPRIHLRARVEQYLQNRRGIAVSRR